MTLLFLKKPTGSRRSEKLNSLTMYLIDFSEQKNWLISKIGEIGSCCGKENLALDIEMACKKNKGFVFWNERDFVVLRPLSKKRRRIVILWVAYSRRKNGIDRYYSFFDALFREMAIDAIRFYTKRKGFSRVAPKFGFENIGTNDGYNIWEKSYGK